MSDPHGGVGCEKAESQLEDAWGDLNAIGLWIARRGVTCERRDDGTFDYIGALNKVERQAKTGRRGEWWREFWAALAGRAAQ